MERVILKELEMKSRDEVMQFLKGLWNEKATKCPLCGNPLELLHSGAKKDNCDWQCKMCNKTYKTMHLLDELNKQMPV